MRAPWTDPQPLVHALRRLRSSSRRSLPVAVSRIPGNTSPITLVVVTRQDISVQQLDFTFEAPQQTRRIWPVRELVEHVREQVEQEYADIWVEGEISNCRPAPSGHLYFTLKDADAQL